jgi:hypothetical protein
MSLLKLAGKDKNWHDQSKGSFPPMVFQMPPRSQQGVTPIVNSGG